MPAFIHGKATKVYLNGYDLTAFFNKCTLEGSADTADVTTFGATSKSYIKGLLDGTASLDGLFEGSAGGITQVLQAAIAAAADAVLNVLLNGDTLDNVGDGFSGRVTKHSVTTPVTGAVSTSMDMQSSVGKELVISHHPLGAETGSVNGSAVNGGAATTNGGVGYLQITAHSGFTNATVKIQDSADGSTGWADILTFAVETPAGAPHAQRVEISGTVRQYTRYTLTPTGGPGSITFFVGFGRK